jgi:APA family basic amino acid/polyamine antiporter
MVGSGIFLSSGYMAQEMSAGPILAAWACGAALALLGVKTYAELARQVPRSGGEYRYLREFMHPAVAYVAGWVTLIIGFAQPTAINALAAAAFLGTLMPMGNAKLVAAAAIIAIALTHALGRSSSRWLQNLLVLAKILLLLGFVALGLFAGDHSWPEWKPPTGRTSVAAFVGSLFYVSYAFSGWNTTVYAAESFRRPGKDVGRAMVIACLLVAAFYMIVNWIFVANLNPIDAAVVMGSDHATLGHAITERLAGEAGARFMSVLAVMTFLSAMSAMLMVGPHIAATMAADGVLPDIFKPKEGQSPTVAVFFQASVALLVLTLHDLQEALESVGATLILFSMLTAIALVMGHIRRQLSRPAPPSTLVAAALYALFSGWLLYYGFRDQTQLLPWLGGVIAFALLGYRFGRRDQPDLA